METNILKLVAAVQEMRKYQKLYFTGGRSSFCLKEAKKWEAVVDRLLEEYFKKKINYTQAKLDL